MEMAETTTCNHINAQSRLWEVMRNRQLEGFQFQRWVLVEPFIVDFACLEHRFIVELDGMPNSEQQYYDLLRTEFLRNKGFVVLRFWRREVLTNMPAVITTLQGTLKKLRQA